MFPLTKIISLSPDDEPVIFYKKILYLSKDKLDQEILRFEKYANYAKILTFHLELQRRPELNLQVKYSDRYGFHISSCIKSLIDGIKPDKFFDDECTCENDFDKPEYFLRLVKEDYKVRCKLCKHYYLKSQIFICEKTHKEDLNENALS